MQERQQQESQLVMHYIGLKCVQIVCGIYGAVAVLYPGQIGMFGGARDPDSGHIIDPNSKENTSNGVLCLYGNCRAVIATNTFQLVCLGLSRFGAFSMYPGVLMVFHFVTLLCDPSLTQLRVPLLSNQHRS